MEASKQDKEAVYLKLFDEHQELYARVRSEKAALKELTMAGSFPSPPEYYERVERYEKNCEQLDRLCGFLVKAYKDWKGLS